MCLFFTMGCPLFTMMYGLMEYNTHWSRKLSKKFKHFIVMVSALLAWTCPPAETSPIGRDVDAAVGQVGGDWHKLCDKTCPAHQSEGADKLAIVSNHTENVTCAHDRDRRTQKTHTFKVNNLIINLQVLQCLQSKGRRGCEHRSCHACAVWA